MQRSSSSYNRGCAVNEVLRPCHGSVLPARNLIQISFPGGIALEFACEALSLGVPRTSLIRHSLPVCDLRRVERAALTSEC
jgi:hypothetical protein